MRTLLLVPMVLCSLSGQAKWLRVELIVSPGHAVVQRLCPEQALLSPNSALASTGNYSFNSFVETHYPGSVSVSVSGGVPPYRYDWHGEMADASTCSAMPGMVRVTVSDAEGNSVTKTAHIGSVQRVLSSPCENDPLWDPTQVQRKDTRSNYYGSAKPVKRSAAAPLMSSGKPELRTGHQYIPPGPSQGGGGARPRPLPVSKVVR